MVRFGLGLGLVASWCAIAAANGRPAGTSTINFEQGHPDHIAAGMTFGLVLSNDGGATWRWMCEKTVGYGGLWDPDYAYSSSGGLFATTFDGLKVMRDGCTFAATPPGSTFVSADELAPNGNLFYAAADPADAKIYKSIDDGMTFPTSAAPGQNNDWWDTLVFAPSSSLVAYLSGYRFTKQCAGGVNAGMMCVDATTCPGSTCDPKLIFLLFKTTNGGGDFASNPLSQTGIATSNNSRIDVVGVDPGAPNTVYIHVSLENGNNGDSIYKSTNGGASWSKILTKSDPFGMAFLVRSDGKLIAATQTSGAFVSNGGAGCTSEATCGWTALTAPPHINCLVENPATVATTHEVWACTHNYDSPGIPGDGFGIMKTTDLATWTGVLRYQDIAGPVMCGTDTVQYQQCVDSYQAKPSVWCCLEQQLGITSTEIDCSGPRDCGVLPDSPSDGGTTMVKPPKGCCESGGGAGGTLLAFGTLALLSRRRRRTD
jgi:hypothetical protein